jgi:hypothetical protein
VNWLWNQRWDGWEDFLAILGISGAIAFVRGFVGEWLRTRKR